MNSSNKLNFQGGWDSTFTSPSGETKTNSMTIIDGKVVFDEGCLAIGELQDAGFNSGNSGQGEGFIDNK